MEHEVFVPVPVERLKDALGDPVRVARAVPGLQQDAGADPVAGRLKVRIGSHSITYRGAVHVAGRDDGSYAVEGDAAETRGTGSVKLALTLRLRDTDGGTTLTFDGTATADGRVTELPQDAVGSAVLRLLNRFAEALGEAKEEQEQAETPEVGEISEVGEAPEVGETSEVAEISEVGEAPEVRESPEVAETPEGAETSEVVEGAETPDVVETPEAQEAPDEQETPEAPEAPDEQETPEAPEAQDEQETPEAPEAQEAAERREAPEQQETPPASLPDDFVVEPAVPPAEAAHARRTMIGRSAEEVDHAPPRGRYAPVPALQTVTSGAALRWAAPAAAVALASAVVVTRVLRKRR